MPGRLERSQPYVDLATFHIGDACCAIPILMVQEIYKLTEVTPVPLAPDYVKGVLNLRGRIITVMDVGKRLGLPARYNAKDQGMIIVYSENEFIGLCVDRIGDVVRAGTEEIEKPPANVAGIQGKFFEGVLKAEKELICILNLAELLG